MDAAALRGKNMKNVIRQRGFKRRECPDRRKNSAYGSLLVASKKIMQKDTEVGRIAMAVPVIISRALEMFLKSLLTKACLITQAKFSNVVSVAHMKQCIESEKLFHFLKDLAEAATSTATQMDNKGMSVWPIYRTKRTTVPFQNHLEQERSCPKGASSHLKVTPAQVSQSSTSAYNLAFQQHITSVDASFGVSAAFDGQTTHRSPRTLLAPTNLTVPGEKQKQTSAGSIRADMQSFG